MKMNDVMKLQKLGFHLGRSANSDHNLWSRHCNEGGAVKAVLCVRDDTLGYEYRVLVANPEQREQGEQWFAAADLADARQAVEEALVVWRKARRALEGGLARRFLRKLITR